MSHDAGGRVMAYLRANAGSERAGPFIVKIDPRSDIPGLSYAVPDVDAAPSGADVAALVEVFRGGGRQPRLEYVDAAAPAVRPALLAAGFVVEARYPLMVWREGKGTELEAPGFDVAVAIEDDALAGAVRVQHDAYQETRPFTGEDVARLRRMVAAGGLAVLARDRERGEPAGAGMCTPVRAGVTELAGIGVAPRFRRRGVAGAVTSALVRETLRRGTPAIWLTPGAEAAERVYRRAGFARAGEVLHIGLPGPPSSSLC